ncbi:roadblock/LC7 domain-containing protein [Euzebya pacifica]|uniref:roadblock/LC7 domain-containing protein n=1 Tax=Euzebya pacifica TaxID=1608957 RepID=UPI0013E0AA79|nr:roadblock/LC7 domain-containing protein [Euzebya pacifica]
MNPLQPAAPPQPVGSDDLQWLLNAFVNDSPGVNAAVVVSVDGLLVTMDQSMNRETADSLAAVVSGLSSMALGAGEMFNAGRIQQQLLQYPGGFLIIRQLAAGAVISAIADRNSDIGRVGHQLAELAKRVGPTLSPEIIDRLKADLPR